MHHVDGLAQDCSDSSALAMELGLHKTNDLDVKWCALVRKMVRRVRRKTNFLWSYGDKYEKHCYTLNWFICVWIFEKWLNGKGWYYCKLHFILSCIMWKNKTKKNQYVQRAHGTKLITGLNNYCMLYRPMLLVLKTVNPLLSLTQTVIFQGSNMVGKYCIAYLEIILVNIQGGWFSSIHQEMRLITYFEKAFKIPCFEVLLIHI